MHALEQGSGVLRALQTPKMELLTKLASSVHLKMSTPGCISADWYIIVLKIQTKICKGERQVKNEPF